MKKQTEKEYIAPWKKAFDRVLTALEEFIHRQTTSGILLMFLVKLLKDKKKYHLSFIAFWV
jgi:hypothetical protein